MGTIVARQSISALYAVYYNSDQQVVAVEDLADISDRVVQPAKVIDPLSHTRCDPPSIQVTIDNTNYCF